MEAAQPGLALAAVAPYKSGPGLSSGVGGDTGTEEIESSGQEPSTSTGQTVSGENVKHSDCDSSPAHLVMTIFSKSGKLCTRSKKCSFICH